MCMYYIDGRVRAIPTYRVYRLYDKHPKGRATEQTQTARPVSPHLPQFKSEYTIHLVLSEW